MEKLSNKISETFIPVDDEGAERSEVAGQPVIIYRPKRKVVGLTFLVTAANMPISKYSSIINTLTSVDHVVVGIYVNAITLNRNAHRMKAEAIPEIFGELKSDFRVNKYDIVGHSVGGKIALLTAALILGVRSLSTTFQIASSLLTIAIVVSVTTLFIRYFIRNWWQ